MKTNQCNSCEFFEPWSVANHGPNTKPNSGGDGWCHRYAPKPLHGGSGIGWSDWEWPSISAQDSCGEFQEAVIPF